MSCPKSSYSLEFLVNGRATDFWNVKFFLFSRFCKQYFYGLKSKFMSSSPNAVSCIFVFLKKLNCHKLSLFACNVTFYLTLKWASLPSQDFIIIQQHWWWSHASIALCETKFFCIDKKIKESAAPSSVNEQKQISFCHKFNFCCWYGPVLMEQFSHNEMFFVG